MDVGRETHEETLHKSHEETRWGKTCRLCAISLLLLAATVVTLSESYNIKSWGLAGSKVLSTISIERKWNYCLLRKKPLSVKEILCCRKQKIGIWKKNQILLMRIWKCFSQEKPLCAVSSKRNDVIVGLHNYVLTAFSPFTVQQAPPDYKESCTSYNVLIMCFSFPWPSQKTHIFLIYFNLADNMFRLVALITYANQLINDHKSKLIYKQTKDKSLSLSQNHGMS